MAITLPMKSKPMPTSLFEQSNVFTACSPRMYGRKITVLGPTNYDVFLILEFDPNISAFCERPPITLKLNSDEKRTRDLDFWVVKKDGEHYGLIVSGSTMSDTELANDVLARSALRSGFRCEIWQSSDLLRRVQFIRNLKQILPYVAMPFSGNSDLKHHIENLVIKNRETGISIRQLASIVRGAHPTLVYKGLFDLFHDGKIAADLDHNALSADTLWRAA